MTSRQDCWSGLVAKRHGSVICFGGSLEEKCSLPLTIALMQMRPIELNSLDADWFKEPELGGALKRPGFDGDLFYWISTSWLAAVVSA